MANANKTCVEKTFMLWAYGKGFWIFLCISANVQVIAVDQHLNTFKGDEHF